MIKIILKLERLAILLLSALYCSTYFDNWFLVLFLLVLPDLSMLGYLINAKIGAILYNLVHNYVLALILFLGGVLILQDRFVISSGLILLTHISIDRFFGFGLKEFKGFKHTHLGKIGK